MPRSSYHPYLPRSSSYHNDDARPASSYPQNDQATFQNSNNSGYDSYAPSQSAHAARRRNGNAPNRGNTYAPNAQNIYIPSGLNQNTYRPNNPNTTTSHHHNRARPTHLCIQDDIIAPKATSHSISSLTRWAHTTTHIPSAPPHKNEIQIVERIEERYGVGTRDGRPRYNGGSEDRTGAKRDREVTVDGSGVRKGNGNWEGKRRKIGSNDGVIDLTGDMNEADEVDDDYDHAQSSEWSWPGDK